MSTLEIVRGGLGADDDDNGDKLIGDEPPEHRPPGVEIAVRHDIHDGEIVDLPKREPIEITAKPTAVPLPWNEAAPERRPIIAEWLRDADQRAKALRWWAAGRAHSISYHAVRIPEYGALHVIYAPRGCYRCYTRTRNWVNDPATAKLRDAAEERGDDANFQKYDSQRRKTRAERIKPARITWTIILVAFAYLQIFYWMPETPWIPHLIYWSAMSVITAVLGYLGQRPDRPILRPAIVPNAYRKLSPGVVLRAFEAAKLSSEKDPITFATGLHRDANGYSVVIDLPYGKTAERAIDLRNELASGLDVDERQLFISRVRGVSGSMRRIHLWVCDVDPLSIPAGPSPLLDAKHVNFWQPWPFGKNERGEDVTLCTVWGAMLIGAIPRRGKTFVARLIALAGALDPNVKLLVWDLKGSPDWTSFQLVADRIFFGDRADPETGVHPLNALLETVHDLLGEVDRRNRVLRSLPKEVCPEGKLTEDLARNKSIGMPLVLLVIDEIQRAFGNKDLKDQLEDALTDLVKVGPSVGIMTVCATQKPDAKSTPTGFRDQFGIRFGMYVTTRDASEAILGAGAGGEGMHAHRISPEARGAGILRGTGDAAVSGGIVRTGYADAVDAEVICTRARALREAAGTLDGMALGHIVTATPLSYSITEDLAVVLGADEQAHSDVLCARLADSWPDRYAGWAPAQLSAALKPHGVRTRQVWATCIEDDSKKNRQGIARTELLAALTPQDLDDLGGDDE